MTGQPYTAAVPARVAPAAKPSGWWGMAVFVATEATLFGTLLGSYFYLRFHSPRWPPAGISEPHLTLPLVLTGALVLTSVPMQLSLRAARSEQLGIARLSLLVAAIVQTGYLAMQIHLFAHDLTRTPPGRSAYASIYFTLLGAHHAHVFVGLLLDVWLLLRLLGGLTRYRLVGLQSTVFYWHFVNVLALAVVGAQLSPRA